MYIQHLNKNNCLILLLSFFLFPSIAFALASDIEKPVNIEADTVVFDNEKGTADYEGNVIIIQGSLELLADKVNIQAPEHEISSIVAFGAPVKLKQTMDDGQIIKGRGNKVSYDVKAKTMILLDDAKLEQGQDVIVNNYIKYLPGTGKLHAGGKKNSGRVKAIFHPTNTASGKPKPAKKVDDKPEDKSKNKDKSKDSKSK